MGLAVTAGLGLFSGPVVAQTPSPTPVAEIFAITSGVSVEKELNAGQAHAYLITLTEGQYLRLTAPQKGINIALTLLSPDGQKLVEHDKWTGVTGIETFSIIAPAAGTYRLEVRVQALE